MRSKAKRRTTVRNSGKPEFRWFAVENAIMQESYSLTRVRASVQAHRFELLAPGVGDRRFAAVGQHDRRAVRGVQRIEQGARRKLRRLRELLLHVLGADRLDIGEAAAAEQRECFPGNLG